MAKHEIDLTADEELGAEDALVIANASRPDDDQIADVSAYLQFVMASAAGGWFKTRQIKQDPASVIAAKDAEIADLKAQLAAKDAALADLADAVVIT